MLPEKVRKIKFSILERALLFGILATGFLLRFSGIGWGLPYLFHPDEFQVVNVYLSMLKAHSLNPHYFIYPALPFYINGFFYAIYYRLLRWTGTFHNSSDIAFPQMLIMGTGIIADQNVYYIGRLVSIAFGVGTIYLSYRCAKEISKNPFIGLLAAAFTAVSNANIIQSRLILPNIFVAFFAILTLWFSLRLFATGQTRYYLLAGIAVGLTIGSKYNGAVVAVTLVAAHFLRTGRKGWGDPRLYLAGFFAGIGFLATNVYTVLDFKDFFAEIFAGRDAYVLGWPGFADIPLVYYSTYLFRFEGIVAAAALAGILYAVLKRQPYFLIAGSFPFLYLVMLSMMKYYNEHTLLHMLPFVDVIAACFLGLVIEKGQARLPNKKLLARAGTILLIFIAVAWPLRESIMNGKNSLQVNSRTTAQVWIEQNIPQGSRIGLEAYSPYVDPLKYDVVGVSGFLPHERNWYEENHFEYLVFSQGMYGRYYYNPEKFAAEIEQYEQLFASLKLVKIFNDGGYEIRIYRMK